MLSQDGSIQLYSVQHDINLKYPTFVKTDALFLGYEQPDLLQQKEILELAASNTQIYGNTKKSSP